jgi:hypothetical protein
VRFPVTDDELSGQTAKLGKRDERQTWVNIAIGGSSLVTIRQVKKCILRVNELRHRCPSLAGLSNRETVNDAGSYSSGPKDRPAVRRKKA